jgi:hypothetical protein
MVMIDTALNAYPDRLAAPVCWRLSIAGGISTLLPDLAK